MKSIETFEITEATQKSADALMALYDDGKIFTENGDVQRSCELYMAANEFADTFGVDLAKAAGQTAEGSGGYSILYNLKVEIEVHLGGGRCAVGVRDFENKVSYYLGIRKCKL